ncbi:hypothetical protein E4N71_03280 [Treponema vincentii]|uniref:hypothetical protein n=1 Tax=Treponema vincentii TaxID=69710 RepID=UPI003D8D65B4
MENATHCPNLVPREHGASCFGGTKTRLQVMFGCTAVEDGVLARIRALKYNPIV